jgi:hypothetical protein
MAPFGCSVPGRDGADRTANSALVVAQSLNLGATLAFTLVLLAGAGKSGSCTRSRWPQRGWAIDFPVRAR